MEENDVGPQDVIEILMLTCSSNRTNPSGTPLVNPEELMSRIFCRVFPNIINLKTASCDESIIDEANDAFDGQYPILIYKHWFIPRRYIWQFWCQLSEIDIDLSDEAKEETKVLSELI